MSIKLQKLRTSLSSARVPSKGAKWALDVEATFVDLMYAEVVRGNIYTTSFTPSIWKDIMNNLALQTGLLYNIKKLKAKHSRMKGLWRKFHDLMIFETGLGWNEVTNMLIGSPQLWEQIAQNNPKNAELRHKRCPHYQKLTTIFCRRNATGYVARASTQMPHIESALGSESVGGVGNDADDMAAAGTPMQAETTLVFSTQKWISALRAEIALWAEIAAEERRCQPESVLEPLRKLPGVSGDKFYEAIEFLQNRTRRRIFLAMTQDEQFEYLQKRLGW